MRIRNLALAATLFAAPIACGSDKVVDQTGLTGVRLSLGYDANLKLTTAVVSSASNGMMKSSTVNLPSLDPTSGHHTESVVIIVADGDGGKALPISVEGRAMDAPVASGSTNVTLIPMQLVDGNVELAMNSGAVCGNGKVESPESCDDGNTNAQDGCSHTCTVEPGFVCTGAPSTCHATCGNGMMDPGEHCDDGNTQNGDGCSSTCNVEPGFVCPMFGMACKPSGSCGDGIITGQEECDDHNTRDGDGCSSTCTVEAGWVCTGAPSNCRHTCGNGQINNGERCDDGNTQNGDGCSATCTIEQGYTCPTPGMACVPRCGDGMIIGSEACDDDNTHNGDGCSSTCTIEPGYTCTGMPSMCTVNGVCGDGHINTSEACDDGNTGAGDGCSPTCTIEPGFVCQGMPSMCTRCGNGMIDSGEVCDGMNTGGETCLSQGHLNGTISCNATCTALVLSSCGAPIDTAARIQQAIDQAYMISGGPEVVSIQAGSYVPNNELLFDECATGCGAGGPSGLTLQPLNGQVTLIGRRLHFRSGNNTIQDITIRNAANAVQFDQGNNAGGNTLTHLQFQYEGVSAGDVITVQSDSNRILACQFRASAGGTSAISIDGGRGTTFAMNVIFGAFASAIHLVNARSGGGAGPTLIDQNSIWIQGMSHSIGLWSEAADNICYRSNIIWGNSFSTGLQLDQLTLAASCAGGASGNNDNGNNLAACTGASCAQACGAMCTLTTDPGFASAPQAERANLCLRPSPGNTLIDAGADLGYDLVDGSAMMFNGAAPDIGAREAGSTRSYGGISTSCP